MGAGIDWVTRPWESFEIGVLEIQGIKTKDAAWKK
jgi:hypothetical protein